MGKTGRPRLGGEARTERILVCVEPSLRTGIEDLAEESRRSLSDYCRYVLEQHVIVVKEEEATEEPIEEVVETTPPAPSASPESESESDPELPRCPDCGDRFNDCNC